MADRQKLQKALCKPYDRLFFGKEVLREVFPGFVQEAELIPAFIEPTNSEKKSIDKVYVNGHIELGDGTEITCYEIHLQPQVRIEQSRVGIQQYVRKLISAGEAALVNFISPVEKDRWRFTLVAKDSEFTKEGIKETSTHTKRYTYLVEIGDDKTNRTMAQRLEELSLVKEQNLQLLIKTFSVESLSKEFFAEYKAHYEKFVSELKGLRITSGRIINYDPQKTIRDFVKKTLGRLIFLYFVQRKRWMGASTTEYMDGDKNFLMNLFNSADAGAAFYETSLKGLFFDTLNTKRKDDDFKMPDGSIVKIPFLNGGLFDKEEIDKESITINPLLFHHPNENDNPKKRGFFDFLNAYNFTVHEDSPNDHTVAVDPEMLGHIFENLLEDNKDKGAFYTPKQVVHYMCTESLIEYLKTNLTNLSDFDKPDSVDNLVRHKEINGLRDIQLGDIDKLLDKVTICDPAIGSGAFPMGLLQEIHSIKEAIANELHNNWNPAKAKKNIIQRSIYGVDIEKGAVDIARLRFWLSLVVDEEKPQPLPNLDYKIMQGNSLLESFEGIDLSNVTDEAVMHKEAFQRGLFGEIKGNMQKTFQKYENTEELKTLIEDYFSEISHEKKEEIRIKIENHVYEHIEYNIDIASQDLKKKIKDALSAKKQKEKIGKKLTVKAEKQLNEMQKTLIELDSKVIKAKESRRKREKNYFLWHLFFKDVFDNGGFDIVIGNPPYVQLQKMGKAADELKTQNFETFERTGDIYCLFYEKGINLLKEKGVLTYIASSQWMLASYGKALRKYFSKINPLYILQLGPGVFYSAVVDTNIVILQKSDFQNILSGVKITRQQELNTLQSSSFIIMPNIGEGSWAVLDENQLRIKEAFNKKGKPLEKWNIKINFGIKTGYNDAFLIDKEKRNEIVSQDKKSAEIILPILRGRDIQKYYVEWNDSYIIATFPSMNLEINKYKGVKGYLNSFQPKLNQTGETFINSDGKKEKTRKKTSNNWFETQDQIGFKDEFKKEKVIWKRIGSILRFSYSDKEIYCLDSTCIATGEKIKYLTALLNSKLINYQLHQTAPKTGMGDLIISVQALEPLQVYYPSKEEELIISNIVDYILLIKEEIQRIGNSDIFLDNMIRQFEIIIDLLVYELYFEKHLKELEIDIMKFIDFPILEEIKDYEEKKREVQDVWEKLQEKANPIRNRILVSESRSPDIIKRINHNLY